MRKSGPSRRPRIALYGQCGFGNFGNDATMELVLTHLRRTLPALDYVTITRVPSAVEASLNVPSLPMYAPPRFKPRNGAFGAFSRLGNEINRVWQALQTTRSLDYLIMAGGGRFDDFNSSAMEQPYWLWKWISLARAFRVPVEFIAIGAGPVDFKLSKLFYKSAGNAATRRSFRDEESKRYAHDQLGVKTRWDELTNDLVFAFPVRADVKPAATPVRTIGVGVMEYNNRRGLKGGETDQYEPYLAKLTILCLGLLERGYKVRILIGETCDMSAARDLYARLEQAAPDRMADVILAPTAITMHDVIEQIAQTDAVIATRFHNIVAALMLGRPTISLGYASKSERLMEDFGLGAYCQTVETFDPARLLGQVENLTANAAMLAPRIQRRAGELRRAAEICLEHLTSRIRRHVVRLAPEAKPALPRPRRARLTH